MCENIIFRRRAVIPRFGLELKVMTERQQVRASTTSDRLLQEGNYEEELHIFLLTGPLVYSPKIDYGHVFGHHTQHLLTLIYHPNHEVDFVYEEYPEYLDSAEWRERIQHLFNTLQGINAPSKLYKHLVDFLATPPFS